MSDGFWMLLVGLACYASFGFAMLYLTRRSERRMQILVEELRPREPGVRRSGVVIPMRHRYGLEDEA